MDKRLFRIWKAMVVNAKRNNYPIAEEFLSYPVFRDWAYTRKYSDERPYLWILDLPIHYDKMNCYFTKVPMDSGKLYKVDGVIHSAIGWCRELSVDRSTLTRAMQRGETLEEFIESRRFRMRW